MKRKVFLIAILGLTAGLVIFFSIKSVQTVHEKQKNESKAGTLPFLPFQFLNNGNINPHINTVVAYFSPDCDYCQELAHNLSVNRDSLEGCQIVMVSTASTKEVQKFIDTYSLKKVPQIKFAVDTGHRFYLLFGTSSVPALFIYNKSDKLVRKILGETTVHSILKTLKNGK